MSQPTMEAAGDKEEIRSLTQAVRELQVLVQQMWSERKVPQFTEVTLTPPSVSSELPEPPVPLPEPFRGDRSRFREFRSACTLHFSLKPRTYQNPRTKVLVIISLLQEEPRLWANGLLEENSPLLDNPSKFFAAMGRLYDDPYRQTTAESALCKLRQGSQPVEDYLVQFRIWAPATGWNDMALFHQFRLGLSEAVKDELARVELPDTLEELARLAVRIDRRLRERQRERTGRATRVSGPPPGSSRSFTPDVGEPMEVGHARGPLSSTERARRLRLGLCLYCSSEGHRLGTCPNRPVSGKRTTIFRTGNTPSRERYLMAPLTLGWGPSQVTVKAMVDSGASICLMDELWARRVGIPLVKRRPPLQLRVLDGTPLAASPVTHVSIQLQCSVGGKLCESRSFEITRMPEYPVILGIDWLTRHNPAIDWENRVVRSLEHSHLSKHSLGVSVGLTEGDGLPACYREYGDVFDEQEAEALPPHRPYDCPVELLPGAPLPVGHVYPLSEPELAALREYLETNQKKGFIRPSTSPVGAGIFFVKKKEGTLRPVVDYRGLNKITIKNKYPLPLIPELMERLRGARIFTKLDLRGAYNLIRIRPGDEWKTAFRTRYGLFECLVMPFGLCNAPATFQCFINDVFRDILDVFVIVYLDDILIYSRDLQEHQEHVRRVLARLRTHRLFAKLSKCEFHQSEIAFLGYIVTPGCIKMDQDKVTAVLEWPIPNTRKRLQAFLGFANYYRKFIPHFSKVVAPLSALTSAKVKFAWGPEPQRAFEDLKQRFTTAPILRLPDPTLPYVLEVDASETALGAVLSQRADATKPLHPVAFFSRKLTPAEKNYPIGEKELLAIKASLEHWRHLLEGARHPLLVYSDHKNLQYLQASKTLTSRQVRWSLFFNRFNLTVTYRPGSKNGKADALSRLPYGEDPVEPPQHIFPEGTVVGFTKPLYQRVRDAQGSASPDNSGIRLFVPSELRTSVLQACHDAPLAGHPGVHRTHDLLRRSFQWPRDRRDVKKYVEACEVCTRNKYTHARPVGLLQPLPLPKEPWKSITMDFVTDLPPSKGFTTIMVIVDRFTKMAHFVPHRKLPTAPETASLFQDSVIKLHGLPQQIISDRGTQFTSRFWKALCSSLGITHSLSSAFHPQTNGQTERVNQCMEQYLRCYATHLQENWADVLPLAEFAYNNATNASTKMTPFFAHTGRHPAFLPDAPPVSGVPAADSSVQDMAQRHAELLDNLRRAQEAQRTQANKRRRSSPQYQVGDKVWLSTKNIQLRIPTKKLGPLFIGPYPIEEVINPVAFKLKLPGDLRLHPVFHTSLLKPYVPDTFLDRRPVPAPPVEIDGEEEYEVEEILDSRWRYRKLQYLIKWKGYGSEDNSWVDSSDLHAPQLATRFHQSHPSKPGPMRPRSGRK